MPASSCEFPSISIHLPGANSVISETAPGSSTSPSSLGTDDEQLTRTVHYTYDGKSITFEIVNKLSSLLELDSSFENVDPIPDNIFKRITKSIFCFCVSPKTRRAKAKSLNKFGAA